jgi:hypothetical protein
MRTRWQRSARSRQSSRRNIFWLSCLREHSTCDAGRARRPVSAGEGRERAMSLPMVQPGSSAGPSHVLFRMVRRGMASAQQSGPPSRSGVRAGPRRVRRVWRRLCSGVSPDQEIARCGAGEGTCGVGPRWAQDALGRRPYFAGCRRRRRVRPLEYAHLMSEVPPHSYRGVAGQVKSAPPEGLIREEAGGALREERRLLVLSRRTAGRMKIPVYAVREKAA